MEANTKDTFSVVHKPRTSITQTVVVMYLSHLDLQVRTTKFMSSDATGYTQESTQFKRN